jgi:hypothetical protein
LVCTRFFGLLKYVDKRGGYSKWKGYL